MGSLDINFLKSVGKVWNKKDHSEDIITNDTIDGIVSSISSLITNRDPKSVILMGNKGVGKSTLVELVSNNLNTKGWVVFKAAAANLMAGQRYIGDLEQSIKNVVSQLISTKKTVWVIPRFHELYYGGRHEFSPVSILDQILPFVETGELRILAEDDDSRLEKVIQSRPQIQGVFELFRIGISSKAFTMDLVKNW
ncbi:MAG: AAA family ATPase, partial [Bacteroidota bacterium]